MPSKVGHMAEMSMNKAIHGAVRRDLSRFLDALDRFRDGDRARANQLATAWANFNDQLTRHHEGEHETAWPALEAVGVGRELIAQMDDEHDRLAEALASAGKAIATLRGSASAADATAARDAFVTLQTVAVEHLDHEEAELEPIYLSKRDDPAIKAMGREFGRSAHRSPALLRVGHRRRHAGGAREHKEERPRSGAGDHRWHLRQEVPPRGRIRLAIAGLSSGVAGPQHGLLRAEHYDIDDSTTSAAWTRSSPRYVPGTCFLADGARKASPA